MQLVGAGNFELSKAATPWLPKSAGALDVDPVFRQVFFESPQAMLLLEDNRLRVLEANAAAIRLYGYSRREFLEMSLTDLGVARRDGRAHAERSQRKALALFHPDQRHRVKSGAEIAVDLHSWLLHRNGAVRLVMVKEVTELQRAVTLLCQHWHHVSGLLGAMQA